MSKVKRWTIKKDGKVDDVDMYANEPLSIRASCRYDAEIEFLKMARNVLFVKPQLYIHNGAFLLVYHDGINFCADSGPLDASMCPLSQNTYPTIKEALADKAFEKYASDEYQAEWRKALEKPAEEDVEPEAIAIVPAPAEPVAI